MALEACRSQQRIKLRLVSHQNDGVNGVFQGQFNCCDNLSRSEVTAHGVNRNPGKTRRGTDRIGIDGGKTAGLTLNLDVQNLTTPIDAGLGIDPMWTESAAIAVLGKFRCDKGIGCTTVGAAALGLFTFRIGHKKGLVEGGTRQGSP